MKKESAIVSARNIISRKLMMQGLNDVQKALFCGMLNALCWVCNTPNSTTMDRLLLDEPVAAGKDPVKALSRLLALEDAGKLIDLLREVADTVHASLAETDISDDRRRYRIELERRLREVLG